MTNFATYIDTTNTRAPIAQRGKAKQKRVDLRLVALALVVTREGGIPLLSHAYPGDRPDVTQFSVVIDELVARYRDLTGTVESLTIVYDAGQNSTGNHELVEHAGIGFVGSLPPSDHPDLLAIPATRYQQVDAAAVPRPDLRGHPGDRAGGDPPRGADPLTDPARRPITRVRPDPGQGPRPPDRAAGAPGPRASTRRDKATVQAEIDTITKPRWVRDVLTVTLTGEQPADLRLTFRTDTARPDPARDTGSSANGSCSPTATPGPPPRSWPPTAPRTRSSPASGR